MSLELFKDGHTRFSVVSLAATRAVRSNYPYILRKVDPYHFMDADYQGDRDLVELMDRVGVAIFDGTEWQYIVNRGSVTFSPLEQSDGTFRTYDVGMDICVYLCMDMSAPVITCSLNTTYPETSTAYTSRKIGQLHIGVGRVVSDDGYNVPIGKDGNYFGQYWQDNVYVGIIPNCIQDLVNAPQGNLGAMCQVGPHGRGYWVSKYLLSSSNIPIAGISTVWNVDSISDAATNASGGEQGLGNLRSVYGAVPLTGTQGLCAYNFDTLLARNNCRLPIWTEWIAFAQGSPNGHNVDYELADGTPCTTATTGYKTAYNKYAWCYESNTALCRTGAGANPTSGVYDPDMGMSGASTHSRSRPFAVSAWNVDDCVGNIWEWLGDAGAGANRGICGNIYNSQTPTDRSWSYTGPGVNVNVGARAICDSMPKHIL